MAESARDLILVIEDNGDIRAALKAMLSPSFDVELAEDGTVGMAAARKLKPSLILSDLVMPGMSGIDVTRAVRADPELAHIPVIILTAYGELKHKLDGFQSGADDYLQKPFNSRELFARIQALLDNRALQRELARKNKELERVLAELRQAQSRIVESERLQTALKMAGTLAHEINNPLSTIIGLCDLVRAAFEPAHRAHGEIARIYEQAQRIASVVRRIQSLREVRFVPYVGSDEIVDIGEDSGSMKAPEDHPEPEGDRSGSHPVDAPARGG
jgi:DNA-binding response OmpR family regulator